MKNINPTLLKLLSFATVAGDILFVLWVLYNGINEGFKGTTIEKLSYITLSVLLLVNAFLIIRNYRQQSKND